MKISERMTKAIKDLSDIKIDGEPEDVREFRERVRQNGREEAAQLQRVLNLIEAAKETMIGIKHCEASEGQPHIGSDELEAALSEMEKSGDI